MFISKEKNVAGRSSKELSRRRDLYRVSWPEGILWPDLGLQLLLLLFFSFFFFSSLSRGLKTAFKVLTVIWETEPGHSGASH